MSTLSNPFGFRPSFHLGGTPVSETKRGAIATGYATTIAAGDCVKLVGGVLQRAAAGDAFVGVLLGVEYTDAGGKPNVSSYWPASTTATNIIASYTDDPYLTYEVQASGSIAQSNVGNQASILATAATVTSGGGLSNETLDQSTLTTSGNLQWRIVGITPGPDNVYGDAFTIVQVQPSKHQFVAVVNAIA